MSDYAIIFQGLAGLLVLFFIFLTYMNTKTWRWGHVTMMFLVFVAGLAFMYYAAATLKTRATWVKAHDKAEKDVEDLRLQVEKLTRGDPHEVESKTPSVTSKREELARTVLDRGRVWRSCQLANVTPLPNTDPPVPAMTLATGVAPPPPDPNQPAPAAPPPTKKNQIEVKTVFHAFREGAQRPDGSGFPDRYFYIGEFQATAVTDTSVTLVPTMALSQTQTQYATANLPARPGPPIWTLYEVCPIDGHEWLAGKTAEELQKMMPQQETGLQDKNKYDKLIHTYVEDGKSIDKAQADASPENAWVRIKFTQAYEAPVDAPTVNSAETEPFNAQGLAVLDRLRKAPPGKELAPV